MGKALSPGGSKVVRIILIALIVLAGVLEVDQSFAADGVPGPVYRLWSWFWSNVLAYKTVNIGIGGVTVYLLMRHQEKKRSSGLRASVFRRATLDLSIEELEKSAAEHGIKLNLMDDPRISQKNPEAMPNTREMPGSGQPPAAAPKEPPKP